MTELPGGPVSGGALLWGVLGVLLWSVQKHWLHWGPRLLLGS